MTDPIDISTAGVEALLNYRAPYGSIEINARFVHLRETLRALLADRDRLASEVYVPGQWRCAKCGFGLTQVVMRASDGAVGVRDAPGEKCPNCAVPLWRLTERQAGNELADRCAEQMERAQTAEADRDRLARELAEAREPDDGSGRGLAEFRADVGEPLLRRSADWKPIDESHLSVPALIERIWNRKSHAVAPNGHACPFVTLEEWTKIRAYLAKPARDADHGDPDECDQMIARLSEDRIVSGTVVS